MENKLKPNNYGYSAKAFRLNAHDWFQEKMRTGEIIAILENRGNQYQFIVTPKMGKILPRAKTLTGINKTGHYGGYQVEIRKDYLSFRATCKQDIDIPEDTRIAIEYRIYPEMRRLSPQKRKPYRPDGTWFDCQLLKERIDESTTAETIYEYLEIGFQRALEFEKTL